MDDSEMAEAMTAEAKTLINYFRLRKFVCPDGKSLNAERVCMLMAAVIDNTCYILAKQDEDRAITLRMASGAIILKGLK